MRPRSSGYTSLDSLHAERENISWYWTLVAFAAPWMILAGFLMLPATYDDEPQLRVGLAGISVFAVALMTAGYGMSALVCFACQSWIFQMESVFIPCLGACTLALFNILYSFGVSTRYRWNAAAIVGVALASTTTLTYAALSLYVHRKVRTLRKRARVVRRPPAESINSASPAVERPPPSNESPIRYPPRMAAESEEELTRQQMLTLLLKNESSNGARVPTYQNTYRIDLPERRSTGLLQPAIPTLSQSAGSQDSRSARSRSLDPHDLEDGNQSDDTLPERGRIPGRKRRPSREEREERRMEIELGQR